MKDNDFRQLVDREFSALAWTDAHRLYTLDKMNKEEHPVMKKKVIIALALTLSILLMSAAAVAVTVGIPGIQNLIDLSDRRAREYDYQPFTVDPDAIVTPGNQRHTSRLVDIELHEAFLTGEALYLTIHITPAAADIVLWDDAAPPTQEGTALSYFDLYRQDGVRLIDFTGFSLHSPLNGYDYTLFADYTEVCRNPDGVGITCLMAYPLPEDGSIPLSGATVLGKFTVKDCRSRKDEYNVLLFDLPRMTVTEAHDSFLIN